MNFFKSWGPACNFSRPQEPASAEIETFMADSSLSNENQWRFHVIKSESE